MSTSLTLEVNTQCLSSSRIPRCTVGLISRGRVLRGILLLTALSQPWVLLRAMWLMGSLCSHRYLLEVQLCCLHKKLAYLFSICSTRSAPTKATTWTSQPRPASNARLFPLAPNAWVPLIVQSARPDTLSMPVISAIRLFVEFPIASHVSLFLLAPYATTICRTLSTRAPLAVFVMARRICSSTWLPLVNSVSTALRSAAGPVRPVNTSMCPLRPVFRVHLRLWTALNAFMLPSASHVALASLWIPPTYANSSRVPQSLIVISALARRPATNATTTPPTI